jgi:hypothetical protein
MDLVAKRCCDSGAFLATMLEREQSKERRSGYAFTGYERSDDPTFLVRLIVVIRVDRTLIL